MKYDFYLDMNERRSQTIILKKVKPYSVVLELGSHTGIMTDYMKNALNCKVYICEIDPIAIGVARQYAEKAWQGDLETLDWVNTFKDIKFDYIICADILEHLKNPAAVLRATNVLLKEDGSVFLSIPNIAHNSVIYDLIHNKFEYMEWGILDKTHLRFFTYFSLKKMCNEAGYTPVEEDAAYQPFNPPDKEQNSFLNKKFGNVLQFVFELKRTNYVEDKQVSIIYKIENNTERDATDGE